MGFSKDEIQQVWEKGTRVANADPNQWRKDCCGAWINREQYGNRDSEYGWEIDHITPRSNDGPDCLSNLRPLHWYNNAHKSNGRVSTAVTAEGNRNVRKL